MYIPPAPSIDPSIKVIKTLTYRGGLKVWSNRYHFDNLAPADATKWTALSDAVVLAEKAIYVNGVCQIIGTVGYDAGSEVPVFSKTYATNGTGTWNTAPQAPGAAAAIARFATSARSVKNHPIYLFNYWHGVYTNSIADPDTVNAAQKTAYQTYANAWITGFSDGSITHHRCGPQGHVATGMIIMPNVRHRDFSKG